MPVYRPLLETLEPRLPPGDTLLGLLFLGGEENSEFRIQNSESRRKSISILSPMYIESFVVDSSFIVHYSSFADAQTAANRTESVATWPRSDAAITRIAPIFSRISAESVASWPMVSTPVSGSAVQGRVPGQSSFPNSGSGTPVRETPFRRPAGDETEFPGPTFPNRSSGTRDLGYGSLPFYFEQNAGQADASFDFVARGPGYTLGFSATEAVMAFPNSDVGVGCVKSSQTHRADDAIPVRPRGLDAPYDDCTSQLWRGLPTTPPTRPQVSGETIDGRRHGQETVPQHVVVDARDSETLLRMQIVGANPNGRAAGVNPLETRVNYFLGNDPAQWHTNVPTFGRVQYDDVYPGIDLVYYGNGGQLEYDFVLSPHVDPNQIQLTFAGADSVTINSTGDLVLQTGDIEVRQQKPYIYQEANGTRQEVAGEFRITDPSPLAPDPSPLVSFDVGAYDPSRPLVIDPVVLAYSTYLGGSGTEYGKDIAVDKFGSAYVTGETDSLNFPIINPYQSTKAGSADAFVTKLSPDGKNILYSTYLGSSYQDYGFGIAVDASGSVYVGGSSLGGNFPTTPGSFQPNIANGCAGGSGCADAFITKLSPDGAELVYSTYLGGIGSDTADEIAIDAAGNVYIKGLTGAWDFPTVNPVQAQKGGWGKDSFISKLNPAGSALVYSTYLGGTNHDGFFVGYGGIAVDSVGHAYVVGLTESPDFPTYNAIQPIHGGCCSVRDAFVTKLSPDGSAFVYSTYLGGANGEEGYGIAVDSQGNAYVTGLTTSEDFPTTPGSFQPTKTDNDIDAFVSKISPDGSAFVYSTFLGGSNDDRPFGGIAVDKAGNAYVVGKTFSNDLPIISAFQPVYGGPGGDAFVAKLSVAGDALVYSSYLGGTAQENAWAITVDNLSEVYIVGETVSADFPVANSAQPSKGGGVDAFITKISRSLRKAATAEPAP